MLLLYVHIPYLRIKAAPGYTIFINIANYPIPIKSNLRSSARMSDCNLTVEKGLTFEEISRIGEYSGLENGMTSWRALGGKRLPRDMSFRALLTRFSTGEIDHVEEFIKHFRQMQNGLPENDRVRIACDLLDDPCPAGLHIDDAVEYIERPVSAAPMETRVLTNTLVRAATGELGFLLTSFNSICSAPKCPSPVLKDGQLPIVLPGSRGVQWRHAIRGESISASPLMNFQGSCRACGEVIPDRHVTFVNVFWRNPRHIKVGEDERVYPCTTDADYPSGAPSPDSIPYSDQDESDSGTEYGCGSVQVDPRYLPPPVNISFANMSLGGGPTDGATQREGTTSRRRLLRFSRRPGE